MLVIRQHLVKTQPNRERKPTSYGRLPPLQRRVRSMFSKSSQRAMTACLSHTHGKDIVEPCCPKTPPTSYGHPSLLPQWQKQRRTMLFENANPQAVATCLRHPRGKDRGEPCCPKTQSHELWLSPPPPWQRQKRSMLSENANPRVIAACFRHPHGKDSG